MRGVKVKISATNRGSKRIESDFYATPIPVVDKFLRYHPIIKPGNILEPTAGNGNIIKAIRECNYNNHITAVEIRKEEKRNLIRSGADDVYIGDFLSYQPTRKFRTIISNPPYSIALDVINKCFEIASKDTEIIMLLRLAFLESKRRYDFWKKHPVNRLYILSKRPSFTGKGTDATAYAWFVWDGNSRQRIKII